METPMTEEELMTLIKTEMVKVNRDRVYFNLREMKLNRLCESTVDIVSTCVALEKLGLPITSELVSSIRKTGPVSAVATLHGLGDKKVLTLIRGRRRKTLFWILSDVFKEKMGL